MTQAERHVASVSGKVAVDVVLASRCNCRGSGPVIPGA